MANRVTYDKRFKSDEVFNEINKKFITLKENEVETMSKHLDKVCDFKNNKFSLRYMHGFHFFR